MRQRINRSLIGGQQLITASSASGINTVVDAQLNSGASTWPQPVTTDPYFNYVPLLLNTNTTNAAQNNTFLDSSTNAFTITRNGTPTQGSFTPYQPSGYWSNYFGGNGNYLYTNTTPITSSSSTFTIEGWIYPTGSFNAAAIVIGDTQPTGGLNYLSFGPTSGSNTLMFYWYDGAVKQAVGNTVISLNTWTHIAVSVNANAISLYVNGVQQTITGTSTLTNRSGSNGYLTVAQYNSTYSFIGYISNLSVLVGTAKYSTGFTPSTTPLSTSTTNQTLLVCYSNQFIDSNTATTAKTITIGGTPSIQAFQPFLQPISYSPTAFGGSGYFNGSTDSIYTSQTFSLPTSTTPFTMEAWVYFNAFNGSTIVSTNYANGGPLPFVMGIGSASNRGPGATPWFGYFNGSAWIIPVESSTSLSLNTWYHLAYVYTGTSATIYANGVSIATASVSSWQTTGQAGFYIGRRWDASVYIYFSGYISNFRLVIGTAVYTSNFTPPTTPLTAISNTQLLTNFANAGIYDAAWQNDLTTVANAQVSTTQYKWGTTSMKFNGSTDYLTLVDSPALKFGSGNFTIEGWVYPAASGNNSAIYSRIGFAMIILVNAANNFSFYASSNGSSYNLAGDVSFGAATINAWNYFAVVRNGTNINLYANGTLGATVAVSTNSLYESTDQMIGRWTNGSGANFYMNGYIQDLRITKGVARTITTPGSAFPTYGTNILAVDYLVVAGGGGGAGDIGGGGGAGGYILSTTYSLSTATTYTVTVGGGGAGGSGAGYGTKGSNSVFSSITSIGGGGGSNLGGAPPASGKDGGSGSGARSTDTAGLGTSGQGNNGNNSPSQSLASGGGGGAVAAGSAGSTNASGAGGSGAWSSLSGTSTAYAGGGGGGGRNQSSVSGGAGGTGGGGAGSQSNSSTGTAGTTNTGGGGGGGSNEFGTSSGGGAGGSGIVILRIPSRYTATFSVGLTTTSSTSITGYTIYNITNGTGTVTFNN